MDFSGRGFRCAGGIAPRSLRAVGMQRFSRSSAVQTPHKERLGRMLMPTPPRRRSRRAGNAPATPGRAEFAAAFLQRNRQYRAERARLRRNAPASERIALARRWGLSFRLPA
ncbi:transcriptional regulator domain-containing protein [Sphingomonas sp. CL5.1]